MYVMTSQLSIGQVFMIDMFLLLMWIDPPPCANSIASGAVVVELFSAIVGSVLGMSFLWYVFRFV